MATPPAAAPQSPQKSVAGTPTLNKKEDDFKTLFELPDDRLLENFSCALQLKSLLLHGRMYISDKNICFYANILGRKTTKIIPFNKVVGIYKKSTAIVFSNALEVVTRKSRYFFSSFMFRDGAYKSLTQGWSDFVGDNFSKVVLKPDGAEIFTKPTIPGEIPYVTDETEEDSSDDSLSAAAAAAAQIGLTQAGSPPTQASSPLESTAPISSSDSITPKPEAREKKSRSVDRSDPSRLVGDGSALGTVDEGVDALEDGDGDQPGTPASSGTKIRRSSSIKKSSPGSKGVKTKRSRSKSTTSKHIPKLGGESADEDGDSEPASDLGPPTDMKAAQSSSAPDVAALAEVWDSEVNIADKSASVPAIDAITAAQKRDNRKSAPAMKSVPKGRPAHSSSPAVPSVAETKPPTPAVSAPTLVAEEPLKPLSERKEADYYAQFTDAQIDRFLPVKPPCTGNSCEHFDEKESTTQLAEKEFVGITPMQWFLLFWANPNWTVEFAVPSDYTELSVGEWKYSDAKCCCYRNFNYRLALKSIGPKSTRVESVNHIKMKSKTHMIIESCAKSLDVPFGDAFTVHEKWSIVQTEKGCKVTNSIALRWKKAAWGFKGTIERKSMEGSKSSAEMYLNMVASKVEAYVKAKNAHLERVAQVELAAKAATPPASATLKQQQPQERSPPTSSGIVNDASEDESSSLSEAEDDSESEPEISRPQRQPTATPHSHSRQSSTVPGDISKPPADSGSPLAAVTQFFASGNNNILLILLAVVGSAIGIYALFAIFGLIFGSSAVPAAYLHTGQSYYYVPRYLGSSDPYPVSEQTEFILFLEHLVSGLIKSRDDPDLFVQEQYRYFKASKDLETSLLRLRSDIDSLLLGLKSARLAQEDYDKIDADMKSGKLEAAEESKKLRQFFHDRISHFKKSREYLSEALGDNTLSDSIRSSRWYIYAIWIVGSIILGAVVMIAALAGTGKLEQLPFKIPLLSK